MDDSRGRNVRLAIPAARWVREGLMVGLVVIVPSPALRANAIVLPVIHAQQSTGTATNWATFLAGGPTLWQSEDPPAIDETTKELFARDLLSPNAASLPAVQYLVWRRSLDPTRFDTNHPQYASLLQNLPPNIPPSITPPTVPPTPPVLPVTPPTGSTPSSNPTPTPTPQVPSTNPAPQILPPGGPQPVPEPSTLLLAPVLGAAGFWWRRRQENDRNL